MTRTVRAQAQGLGLRMATIARAMARWVVLRSASPWLMTSVLVLIQGCPSHPEPSKPMPAATATASTEPPTLSELLRSADIADVARASSLWIRHCDGGGTSERLLSRAASLSLSDPAEPFELFAPIALALSYCDPSSEALLRQWLSADTGKRRAALRALAAMAGRGLRLSSETMVLLLEHPTYEESWFAFAHLAPPSHSLKQRLMEVGIRTIEQRRVRPYWPLRALGKTHAGVVPFLVQVAAGDADPASQLAVVAALAELGPSGQAALIELLDVVPARVQLPILHALRRKTAREHLAVFRHLAKLPADSALHVEVRCRAASFLGLDHSALAECDPKNGRAFKLAWLDAFEASTPKGTSVTYEALLRDADLVVAEQALVVLAAAPNRPEFDPALRWGLAQANSGLVATSARALAKAIRAAPSQTPSRETVQELKAALFRSPDTQAVPTLSALIDAAGALQVLSLKRALPSFCDSKHRVVREAAQRALVELLAAPCSTEPTTAPEIAAPAVGELQLSATALDLEFESGSLSVAIDPQLSLGKRAWLREWIDSGHYDGSRVVVGEEGHWLRIGDPEGDLYPAAEPLVEGEPSGRPFDRRSVALLQFGVDAVTPQLIVALEDRPDLDPDHTRVGLAQGTWAELRHGEVLKRAAWRE